MQCCCLAGACKKKEEKEEKEEEEEEEEKEKEEEETRLGFSRAGQQGCQERHAKDIWKLLISAGT